MLRQKVAIIVVSVLSLALGACVTTPPAPVDPELARAAYDRRSTDLAAIEHFVVHGRVAVKVGNRGWQAGLLWTRAPDRLKLRLSGPMGAGAVHLERDEHGAWIKDARGNMVTDSSAEALLERVTGWWLPLEGLDYWVRGLVAPREAVGAQPIFDVHGRISRLLQHGWQLEFVEYQTVGGHDLPRRIFLVRKDDGRGAISVRLVISHWDGLR